MAGSTVTLRSKPRRTFAIPSLSLKSIQWTPRRKKAAAIVGCALSLLILAGGIGMMWWMRPPSLPTSVGEALAVMSSSRFDRLDETRQSQYAAEAARLVGQLSAEERRNLFRDNDNRDALRKLREEQEDIDARKFAHGEKPENPLRGPGGPEGVGRGGGPGGGGPGGGGRAQRGPDAGGGGPGGPGGAGGGGRNGGENRVQRAIARLERALAGGNPQNTALRAEARARQAQQRQQSGGTSGPRRGG